MDLIKRALRTDRNEITIARVNRAMIKRVKNVYHTIMWYLPSSDNRNNKVKIALYKDIHKGKRCFIVANGPSLKNTDLSFLDKEYTIGMNRISLLKDVNGFSPSYLVVADVEIQLKQFIREYDEVQLVKFFPWEVRNIFTKTKNLIFYKMSYSNSFNADFNRQVGAGKSVTIICIELAFFMGFKEVILVGKDHSYQHTESGEPGKRILSSGSESNHFISGYYKKGMKWSIPNYTEEEESYKKARIAYEKDGRKILDATIGGHLNVFEKVEYNSLFTKGKAK